MRPWKHRAPTNLMDEGDGYGLRPSGWHARAGEDAGEAEVEAHDGVVGVGHTVTTDGLPHEQHKER